MFSSLKNGRSACLHFWAVSMVFLADLSGSYATQYNRAANFTARTTKKICQLQKKFSEDPAKISRGSMKSFGLCHEIISPVILKSFGLSQDLPLSQNGQNFRRGEKSQKGKGVDGATGAYGAYGRWARLKRLRGAIGSVAPVGSVAPFPSITPRIPHARAYP